MLKIPKKKKESTSSKNRNVSTKRLLVPHRFADFAVEFGSVNELRLSHVQQF